MIADRQSCLLSPLGLVLHVVLWLLLVGKGENLHSDVRVQDLLLYADEAVAEHKGQLKG
jgi:hypothetical protein